MKKILKDPTYRNSEGYNGLDLSSIQNFSSSVGHIIPVTWDFLQPGDKVRIQSHLRTRTMPLISSAFAEIQEHVRYFFVPMSQIYKPFGDLYHGIQDYGSDYYSPVITNNRLSQLLPTVTLSDVILYFEQLMQDNKPVQFHNSARFMESIGVPILNMFSRYTYAAQDQTWKNHSVNLLPFLAYQKIWYDYFRDTDRIANDPTYYNVDSWVDNNTHTSIATRFPKFVTLQKCHVVEDVANNIFVSPLFGEQGVGGDNKDTLEKVTNWLSGVSTIPVNGSETTANRINPTTTRVNSGLSTWLNVAALRQSFAVEKLLEITRRSKKHYDAQTLAHFGIRVPMGMDGEAIEIMHHQSKIEIGDVISYAATEDASLGEIGGKGYNSEVSPVGIFEASTHGILMAVYYARPNYNYLPVYIDKKLGYSYVYDFPRPEFENLGMQPVFNMNQYLYSEQSENVGVVGWQYRYTEVKSQLNRSFGALARSLSSWNIVRTPVYNEVSSFYVNPDALNSIMDTKYIDYNWIVEPGDDVTLENRFDGENKALCDTDPLIHQLKIDYKKSSKISTYGLSKL